MGAPPTRVVLTRKTLEGYGHAFQRHLEQGFAVIIPREGLFPDGRIDFWPPEKYHLDPETNEFLDTLAGNSLRVSYLNFLRSLAGIPDEDCYWVLPPLREIERRAGRALSTIGRTATFAPPAQDLLASLARVWYYASGKGEELAG